jgi:hypothetical protein
VIGPEGGVVGGGAVQIRQVRRRGEGGSVVDDTVAVGSSGVGGDAAETALGRCGGCWCEARSGREREMAAADVRRVVRSAELAALCGVRVRCA